MKSSLVLFIIFASVVLPGCSSDTPKSPQITAEGRQVKIVYGQPSKNDRVIFGELVPYGKVWRTGANEATEITFREDASFGGKPIQAGTYTLFTIPDEKEWTIILNPELKQWGAFGYEQIKHKDVLQVKVPSMKTDEVAEKLTITFDEQDTLIIKWDQTEVKVPITYS